ncbi:MBL fold metallo-hydrolase [Vulcanisaeta thermophila]|uniref:MBL fold metallo-hydrolase n=1 Tax=Vulcanisaeta thermophila TaxID=867917 RepID=UPI001EE3890A|nr:MBL fold metallo-hydrolase [Vulcanisaeta thermophila]
MVLRVYYDDGVVVSNGRFRVLVDPVGRPRERPDAVLITHAHRDHVNPRALLGLSSPIIMSPQSSSIIKSRDGVTLRSIPAIPGSIIELEGFRVEALNAGHVLGSLMYIIDFGDYRVGVTGDFNVEDSIILRGARALEGVDALVMEATYGSPDYVFPTREEVYGEVLGFVENGVRDGVVVLIGQALGRGQELTALLRGYPMYLDYDIKVLNNALGIRDGKVLGSYVEDGSVVIMGAQGGFERLRRLRRGRFRFMALSGVYAKSSRRSRAEGLGIATAPLSSHSDFPGLVDFTLGSNAKVVYTVYGHAREFARYLRGLGVRAMVIPRAGQTFIDDYL